MAIALVGMLVPDYMSGTGAAKYHQYPQQVCLFQERIFAGAQRPRSNLEQHLATVRVLPAHVTVLAEQGSTFMASKKLFAKRCL